MLGWICTYGAGVDELEGLPLSSPEGPLSASCSAAASVLPMLLKRRNRA